MSSHGQSIFGEADWDVGDLVGLPGIDITLIDQYLGMAIHFHLIRPSKTKPPRKPR
jgi:hypothetical protein